MKPSLGFAKIFFITFQIKQVVLIFFLPTKVREIWRSLQTMKMDKIKKKMSTQNNKIKFQPFWYARLSCQLGHLEIFFLETPGFSIYHQKNSLVLYGLGSVFFMITKPYIASVLPVGQRYDEYSPPLSLWIICSRVRYLEGLEKCSFKTLITMNHFK